MRTIAIVAFMVLMMPIISLAGECSHPGQDGCWNLVVANVRWDANNQLLQGLDKPYSNEAAHQDRVSILGPQLMGGFRTGQVQAAKPRTFLVIVWGMSEVTPSAYKIDGRRTSRADYKDVTGQVSIPKFDQKQNLGAPSYVYRISADGQSPIGASLQFPWNKVTDKTYVLVCSEDHLSVYPPDGLGFEKKGFWFMPEQLALFRTNGVRGSVAPVVSKE